MSSEVIVSIVFGIVMVAIGLFACWLVKWSTDRVTSRSELYLTLPWWLEAQRLTKPRSHFGR